MTTDEMVPTFGLLLAAGSETTATLLSTVTFCLLRNQEVMSKLVAEIRGSFGADDGITMVSVNKLKYELAVLDEAMRIHPPVPHGSIRVTPQEGAIISGEWVAGGVSVGSGDALDVLTQ
jgi:cytochrome P450